MIIDPVKHVSASTPGAAVDLGQRNAATDLPGPAAVEHVRASVAESVGSADTRLRLTQSTAPALHTRSGHTCASGNAQASRLGSDYPGASPTKSAAPPPSSRARLRTRRRHNFGRVPARRGPRCTSRASLHERTPNGNSMPTFGSACIKPAPTLGLNRPRPNACLRGPLWAHDDRARARLISSAAI